MNKQDEEKLKEIINNHDVYQINLSDLESACFEVAAWKEQQMIENITEWLSLNADLYGYFNPNKLNEMVLNCKKAIMEEK